MRRGVASMDLDMAIVEQIQSLATHFRDIEKIVLFGSRARGDNKPKSDVDLAVFGTEDISEFSYGINETVRSLLEFDITAINDQLDPDFLQNVETEGVCIYKKS